MKKILFLAVICVAVVASAVPAVHAYSLRGTEREVEAVKIEIDGRDYLLLTDVCEAYGLTWEWDSFSRRVILGKDGRTAVFFVGGRYYYDGESVRKLDAAVKMKNGAVCVPAKFAKYKIKSIFEIKEKRRAAKEPAAKYKAPKKPVDKKFLIDKIVIDPGHGGKDPGAIGKAGLCEKDVVLDICRRVARELRQQGIDVIMTRDSDRFVPLKRRVEIANENNVDFFVSIHANASRSSRIQGFEIYYLSEATDDNARALAATENASLQFEDENNSRHTKDIDAIIWDLTFTENREESIELAGFICQGVSRRLDLNNRGIKSARFYVLKGAQMPAVLVETAYISNRQDEKSLKKDSFRQAIAEGIVLGVMEYKEEYERTNGFTE